MFRWNQSLISRARALFRIGTVLLAVSITTGCANFYVDTALKDMKPEQVQKVANAKPVQLLFEFQTKGAANARATEALKKQVTDLTAQSGLFSQVSATPVDNRSVLHITLNNVPITDDAFSKGFVTGLTFGLAGNQVTDGYVCTISYLSGDGAGKITKTLRHAIHTTVGAKDAPANGVKSETLKDAVETMVRQIVLNGLNDLATDSAFQN